MKTNKYLFLPIIFLITSCYIYKPYSDKEVEEVAAKPVENTSKAKGFLVNEKEVPGKPVNQQKKDKEKQNMSSEESDAQDRKQKEKEEKKEEQAGQNSLTSSTGSTGNIKANSKSEKPVKGETSAPKEEGIKGKLQPNKYYKIMALGNQYKIQVDKWEGDTLISHKLRRPEKQYKFHKNDIEEETILERRFSKPISDVLTVGAYVAGGAAVLLLVL